MTKSTFLYHSMRMLCATPDFGDQLFDILTPVDLSAFLYAFDISITKKQSRKYMQFWRQIFTDKSWMLWILSHGFEISFVGNDLITIMNWVQNPTLMNGRRRKLYLDLNIVSYVASRKYTLSSDENVYYALNEKSKHFREFARNDNFNQVLQSGVYAKYAELIMGRDLSDDRTVPFVWLDLTITSAVKHEKLFNYQHMNTRANHSTSTGMWYGDKTLRSWRLPVSGGHQTFDMGVLLGMDNELAMNIPLDCIVPKSWSIIRIESKTSSTGAYVFRQQRLFDCTILLDEMDRVDRA